MQILFSTKLSEDGLPSNSTNCPSYFPNSAGWTPNKQLFFQVQALSDTVCPLPSLQPSGQAIEWSRLWFQSDLLKVTKVRGLAVVLNFCFLRQMTIIQYCD